MPAAARAGGAAGAVPRAATTGARRRPRGGGRRGLASSVVCRDISHNRPHVLGRPTGEQLNQYNPANPPIGLRPYGHKSQENYEEWLVRFRPKLPDDQLNPMHPGVWRKYNLVPKENTHNPDSFFYENFRNGGRAFQQVFLEDVIRLCEFPEQGVQLIDVRSNAANLTHYIPFSIRIPLEEVHYALQFAEEEFFRLYACHKPQPGVEIICISHDGLASERALQAFERWGHPADGLFNYRGGTNELFGEEFADVETEVEEVPKDAWAQEEDGVGGGAAYPVARPDWLERVGPFHPKYYPYPSEDLETQKERDSSGTWEYKAPKDGATWDVGPLGTYTVQLQEHAQQIDGEWLRSRMLSNVQFYGQGADKKGGDKDLTGASSEINLALDRAWKPGQHKTNQRWRTVAQ